MGRGANEKSSAENGATAALKAGATRPEVGKVRIGYPWPVHSFGNFIYILPCLLAYCVYARMFPSILDVVIGFSMHFVLTLVPMSVILHRYFSHVAYSANRFTTFVLGAVSCLAYQYGPMWWSGKHRRHHRYCDQPEDPHSWGIFGLWYAWLGWTLADREAHIDVEFVHPSFKNKDGTIHPELRLLDRFWFAPTWIMHAVLYAYFGVSVSTIVWRYTIPSLCCPLATLWFNCQFHPPNATSKAVCKAIDLLADPLATFHGEAYHHDHHISPRKAKRPGPDLGWYLCIQPLLALGVLGPMSKKP